MKQYHYIYRVTTPTGKFYIGRHSTYNLSDNYMRSGKWIRILSESKRGSLKKEIIEFCESVDDLISRESYYIQKFINDELNMNFNNSPVGFASGEYHPSKTDPEFMKRVVQTRIENGTHCHSDETKKKLSRIKTGVSRGTPSWNSGKTKHDDSRIMAASEKISSTINEKNSKLSSEQRSSLYGRVGASNGFYGKNHTQETISKIKAARQTSKNQKKTCPHCNKTVETVNYARHHGENCKAVTDRRKQCSYCGKKVDTANYARWHGDKCKMKNPRLRTAGMEDVRID